MHGDAELSDAQRNVLVALSVVCSSISLIGSLSVVATYWVVPRLRSKFVLRLISFLAASDALVAISNYLSAFRSRPTTICDHF